MSVRFITVSDLSLPIRAGTLFTVVSWLFGTTLVAVADDPKVTITGGGDFSGHKYSWTVTNESAEGGSPIVYVEFPQYRADLFLAPTGWSTKITGRTCIAQGDSTSRIDPGLTKTFSLRVGPAGAQRGVGKVLIRFADGTECKVGGVEVPQSETIGDKYVSLIGLGLALVVVAAVHWSRTRKTSTDGRDL